MQINKQQQRKYNKKAMKIEMKNLTIYPETLGQFSELGRFLGEYFYKALNVVIDNLNWQIRIVVFENDMDFFLNKIKKLGTKYELQTA